MGKSRKRKVSDLEKCWNECFSHKYILPDICENSKCMSNEEIELFFSHLASEKEKLNATKSLLNSFDIVEWRKHTTKMHKCGFVMTHLKHRVKAEFVTQAWAKFYTILSSFQLVPSSADNMRSFHLCEAPGAFVAALNHYTSNRSIPGFHWTATTLNPYYEGNDLGHMIPDDRFIIETLAHWEFGGDFTGNIMSKETLEHTKKRFIDTQIHLITADGSIDCSEDPGEQENIVSLLFLWEVVTALSVLSSNGCFVIKIFTIFEKFSISLLYLLKSVFEEVVLFKPGPSKPGNSEVYVVNKGFLKDKCTNSTLFQTFLNAAINMDTSLAVVNFSNVPEIFLFALKEFVEKSCAKQKQTIENNVESYGKMTPAEDEELKYLKNCIAQRFIKQFEIFSIDNYLSPVLMWKTNHKLPNVPHIVRYRTGSYNDRHQDKNDATNSAASLNCKKFHGNVKETVQWYHSYQDQLNIANLKQSDLILGKKFLSIQSSSFCNPQLFDEYTRIKDDIAVKQDDFSCHFQQLQSDFDDENIFEVDSIILIPDTSDRDQFNTFFTEKQIKTAPFASLNDVHKLLVICNLPLTSRTKRENIDSIIQMLSLLISNPSNAIIKINTIVLSNFWNGILFLIAQLFEKSSFWKPIKNEQSIYMICLNLKSNARQVEELLSHINMIKIALDSVTSGMDVLHVIPIYSLLQSNFRAIVTSSNEAFVKELISSS